MLFKANYFNGKSSKTNQATVQASSVNWKISYTDETNNLMHVSWNVHKIQRSEVYTKGLVSFTYGDTFPFQKIESSDIDFINYINKSEHANVNNKLDTFLHKSIKKTIVGLLLGIVAVALTMYFYIIPTVAVGFASNLNKKSVINFGDYVFKIVATDLVIDKQKSKKLQDFVDAMQINTEFPLKLHVANSNELNAFALSGGKIVVYSSLLEKIENEHQLAALIGHEVSHIENRHILKNVARNVSGALFVSVLFGDVNAATSVLADNAHLFSQLSFTRNLEKEADVFGMESMRNNNLNLHGMPQLFQILDKENTFEAPSYLSNHPALKNRIEYTTEIADKQQHFEENSVLKEKWNELKNTLEQTNE